MVMKVVIAKLPKPDSKSKTTVSSLSLPLTQRHYEPKPGFSEGVKQS